MSIDILKPLKELLGYSSAIIFTTQMDRQIIHPDCGLNYNVAIWTFT